MMWSLKFHTEEIEKMFRLMHQAALCYRYSVYSTAEIIAAVVYVYTFSTYLKGHIKGLYMYVMRGLSCD